MKKILIAGAIVVGATVASVGAASAAGHQGDCPSGGDWFLVGTGFIIEDRLDGNYADQNGDGLICVKVNKGQTAKQGLSFTAKDNTN